MDGEDFVKGAILTLIILLWAAFIVCLIIDCTYREPQAAERANQICKNQGYDFYEKFSRIGLLSTTPVAIECKYVQNYKEVDVELRQTFGAAEVED